MRTLERNKVDIWYVSPSEEVDVLDEDGNFTGEKDLVFGTPIKTKLPLYPANGEIKDRLFGKDASFDMISVSIELELLKDTLLFISEPIENYDTTYDYKIHSISKSLNNYNYGLRGRV